MILKYKIIKVLLIVVFLLIPLINITTVNAKENNNIISLRAGGGGHGGGHSSGGGRGSSGTHGSAFRGHYCSYYSNSFCIISDILSWVFIFCLLFFTTIILYLKVLRASFNSKRYLRMLGKKDVTWKYKNIEKQVIKTFYKVQECWTKMDMEPARGYMDKDLYETFKGKLEWMELGHKRNILKKIRLINLKPVSVYDNLDDSKDLVWFYIKGSMIDYMVDTETHKKIEGNNVFSIPFVEFWKFTRNKDKWVLSKILQKDESDEILFQ